MNSPLLIVIQPKNGATYIDLEEGTLIVGYKLAHGKVFDEPHFVRLCKVSGLRPQVLICASLAAPQFVNSGLKQLVGTSLGGNPFVPLIGRWLQVTGEIRLTPLAGQPKFKDVGAAEKLNIVLQIASESWLRGNGGSCSVVH